MPPNAQKLYNYLQENDQNPAQFGDFTTFSEELKDPTSAEKLRLYLDDKQFGDSTTFYNQLNEQVEEEQPLVESNIQYTDSSLADINNRVLDRVNRAIGEPDFGGEPQSSEITQQPPELETTAQDVLDEKYYPPLPKRETVRPPATMRAMTEEEIAQQDEKGVLLKTKEALFGEETQEAKTAKAMNQLFIDDLVRKHGREGAKEFIMEGIGAPNPWGDVFVSAASGGESRNMLEQLMTPQSKMSAEITGFLTGVAITQTAVGVKGGSAALNIVDKVLKNPKSSTLLMAQKMGGAGATLAAKTTLDVMGAIASNKDISVGDATKQILVNGGFGMAVGAIGSIPSPYVRIPTETAFGYVSSKMMGGSEEEAIVTALTFAGLGMLNNKNLKLAEKEFAYQRMKSEFFKHAERNYGKDAKGKVEKIWNKNEGVFRKKAEEVTIQDIDNTISGLKNDMEIIFRASEEGLVAVKKAPPKAQKAPPKAQKPPVKPVEPAEPKPIEVKPEKPVEAEKAVEIAKEPKIEAAEAPEKAVTPVEPTLVEAPIEVEPIEFSKQIEKKHGVTLDLTGTLEKDDISLSRIVVPEGKRGEGIGTTVMTDIIEYADRNNKRIVLTPTKEFGATSIKRLKDLYKRLGFVENKGKNKDFTTKESMYRVPEAIEAPVEAPIEESIAARFNEGNVDEKVFLEKVDEATLSDRRLPGGSVRNVYNIDGKVIKVAKSPRGLEQNISMGFGDQSILGTFVPELFEVGKDYIVTENVPRNDTETRKFLKPLQKFSVQDWDNKTAELQDVLRELGLDNFMDYNVLWNDFIAHRNWGQRENGEFVLIDEGALNKNVTSTSVIPDWAKQEWEDIKRMRRQQRVTARAVTREPTPETPVERETVVGVRDEKTVRLNEQYNNALDAQDAAQTTLLRDDLGGQQRIQAQESLDRATQLIEDLELEARTNNIEIERRGVEAEVTPTIEPEPTETPTGVTPEAVEVVTDRRNPKVIEREIRIEKQKEYNRLADENQEMATQGIVQSIRDRRIFLDKANHNINTIRYHLDKATSEGEREIIPFLMEGFTSIPDKLNRPDLQKLISSPKVRKELQFWVDRLKHEYSQLWKLLVEANPDLSGKELADYVTHIWDLKDKKTTGVTDWFSTHNKFTEKRHIKTLVEGIEEFDLTPKTLDIGKILAQYSKITNRAIANKRFVAELKSVYVGEGQNKRPLVTTKQYAPSDWVAIKHPAMMNSFKIDGREVTEYNYVPPWMEAPVNVILEPNPSEGGIVAAYDTMNAGMKFAQLSLSLFHNLALAEVAIPLGGLKGLKNNLKVIVNTIPKGFFKKESELYGKNIDDLEMKARVHKAIENNVQLGASSDIPVEKLKGIFSELKSRYKKISPLSPKTDPLMIALEGGGEFFDRWNFQLWEYMHDHFKLYNFEKISSDFMRVNTKTTKDGNVIWQRKKGDKAKTIEEALKIWNLEAGQAVNDMFGGQNFDTLMWNPRTVKWFQRMFLSTDWNVSTLRQFGGAFGMGSFTDTPEGKRYRKRIIRPMWYRALLLMSIGANAINRSNRKNDMEENPDYYPDKDKYDELDYWMMGNTIGHQTHLFLGRDERGQEQYGKLGKQYREAPELFFDRTGFNPGQATLRKMGGKFAAVPQVAVSLFASHYLSDFPNYDIKGKRGWEWGIGAIKTISRSWLPFTAQATLREDREMRLTDLFMPRSKGLSFRMANEMTFDAAKHYFKTDNETMLQDLWVGMARNNIDPTRVYARAIQQLEDEAKYNNTKYVDTIEKIDKELKKKGKYTDMEKNAMRIRKVEIMKARKIYPKLIKAFPAALAELDALKNRLDADKKSLEKKD